MKKLLIVGGGKMGTALINGLLASSWATVDELVVAEPSSHAAQELEGRFPGLDVRGEPCSAEGAVLATKPASIAGVAKATAAQGVKRMISIAAGVTIATIEAEIPSDCAVVRAMPNTPALIGAGATAIAGGNAAGDDAMAWAAGLLSSVGVVVELDEAKLDAVTGLSGSGPAYVFLVAEALIEAGVLNGLDRATSTELTTQTLLGAARLLAEGTDDAATLRAAVTSPGGTTAAGLAALELAGVRAAFLTAVTAATERSTGLG